MARTYTKIFTTENYGSIPNEISRLATEERAELIGASIANEPKLDNKGFVYGYRWAVLVVLKKNKSK